MRLARGPEGPQLEHLCPEPIHPGHPAWIVLGRVRVRVRSGRAGVAGAEEAPFHTPVFVVTHEQRGPLERSGGTTFPFVNDGIGTALDQAREAAGDRDVRIAGGGATILRAAEVADGVQAHRSSTDPVAGRQRTPLVALVRVGAVCMNGKLIQRPDESYRLIIPISVETLWFGVASSKLEVMRRCWRLLAARRQWRTTCGIRLPGATAVEPTGL